uniref:Uncharacterized protein n=1 Tax=Cucumis sativus TaxID=3659 RepID=A0A0A0LY29_CUCSA
MRNFMRDAGESESQVYMMVKVNPGMRKNEYYNALLEITEKLCDARESES